MRPVPLVPLVHLVHRGASKAASSIKRAARARGDGVAPQYRDRSRAARDHRPRRSVPVRRHWRRCLSRQRGHRRLRAGIARCDGGGPRGPRSHRAEAGGGCAVGDRRLGNAPGRAARGSVDSGHVVGGSRLHETARSSVGEVLREVPGVLTRRGSEGTAVAGEQVQGIDSRQVLVLVDGQPVAGARGIKSGAINLDRQSTYRLDRVEVVKGAASAMFGSDAIGGVVNMITREPGSTFEVERFGFRRRARHLRRGRVGRWTPRASSALRHGESRRARQFRSHPADGRHHRRQLRAHRWIRPKAVIRATSSLSFAVNGSGYWNSQRGTAVGEAGLLRIGRRGRVAGDRRANAVAGGGAHVG